MLKTPMSPIPPIHIRHDDTFFIIKERPIWLLLFGVFFALVTIFGISRLSIIPEMRLRTGILFTGTASIYCLMKGLTQTLVICDKASDTLLVIKRIITTNFGKQATCAISDIRAVVLEDDITRHQISLDVDGDERCILDYRTAVCGPPPVAEKLASFLSVRLKHKGIAASENT